MAYLQEHGWTIISVNSPFSGKSIWIKSKDTKRGKGVLIPDVIAVCSNALLIVESAAPYKASDEKKLKKYHTPSYNSTIRDMFGTKPLVTAIGIPASDKNRVRDKELAVFGVSEENRVSIFAPSKFERLFESSTTDLDFSEYDS